MRVMLSAIRTFLLRYTFIKRYSKNREAYCIQAKRASRYPCFICLSYCTISYISALQNSYAMQLIVFNIISSGFNRYSEAAALLVAYLLGGRPIIAGSSADEVNLTEHLNRLPLLQKLSILAGVYSDNADASARIADLQKQVKKIDSLKVKSTEMKQTHNRVVQLVHSAWKPYVAFLQQQVSDYGFSAIRDLKNDLIVGYLHINSDPEKAEKYEMTISDLMQLLMVHEEETQSAEEDIFHSPELFFFGSEFLSDAYRKPPVYSVYDVEATDITTIYLQHCFTFPYLNKCNGPDLQTVRNELLAAGSEAFCNAVDDWCYRCYDAESPEVRLSTFRGAVMPAAASLQQSIQNNEILQRYHHQQNEQSPVEVWIGEVPVHFIWQYYRHFEALQNATWQKLEALKIDPAYHNQRWPVMMLKAEEHSALDKPQKEEEPETPNTLEEPMPAESEIKPVRKYLSVD